MIGVEGPGAIDAVSRWFSPRGPVALSDRDDGAIVFGRWGDGTPCEELVVVRRSATSLEVHPHGGLAASERILSDLDRAGCRRLTWQEWLAASGLSPIEVEVRVAMAQATGPKAARILARQLSPHPSEPGQGLLEGEFERIRRLDREGRGAEASALGERLLGWSALGLRLVRPWRVVVAGKPNVGKSSLVNAVAGFSRSIVSAEPGTTRDVLETRIVLDGWEIDLIDTAGLREDAASATEREGMVRAREAAASADLVMRVVDPTDAAPAVSGGDLVVISKCDLPAATVGPAGAIRTSAITGEGLDALVAEVVRRLVPHEPGPEQAVPFTTRQIDELVARSATALHARGHGSP